MADLSTHVDYPTGSSDILLTGPLTWHKLQELYAVEDGEVLIAPSLKDTPPESEVVPHMQPFVAKTSQYNSYCDHVIFRICSKTRKVTMQGLRASNPFSTYAPKPWALRFPVENQNSFLLYDARRRIIYIGPHRAMSAFTVGAHPEESMFIEEFGQDSRDPLLQYGFEEGHLPILTKDVLEEALYKAALLRLHPIELYLPF